MKCEKSAKIILCLEKFCEKKAKFLEKYVSPFLLLTLRIMVAMVFFKSGLVKIFSIDATIYLFENLYNVPLLPPVFAAYFTIICELGCSTLLILGLATRPMALVLLGMTTIIQLFILQNPEHFYWMIMLATVFVYGAGIFSLDKVVKILISKCPRN